MNKQFTLWVSRLEPSNSPGVEIDLPAMPYALRDALDKARIPEGEPALLSISGCRCKELEMAFNHRAVGYDTPADVYGLNALAEMMTKLDSWNIELLDAMIRMEVPQDVQAIPVGRFYDLACNTGNLNYADAPNDTALGKFFVDNGFLPELDGVSDEVIAKLDFARIGKETREANRGVFLDEGLGYVEHNGEFDEKYKDLDLTPKAPDYAVLLEVGAVDCGEPQMLKLPIPADALEAFLDNIRAEYGQYVSWRCADCRAPALADAMSTAESIAAVNAAAVILKNMSQENMTKFKSLLAVTGAADLDSAMRLAETLDEYVLTGEFASAEDIAVSRIQTALPVDEAKLLTPHVKLYSYGREIMKQLNMELTEYGALERKDGQPIQTPGNDAPERGGMEMI